MNTKVKKILEKIKEYKKQLIAFGLSFTMLVSVAAIVIKKNNHEQSSEQNIVGYDDVNGEVEDDNFVIIDAGDNDSLETWFQDGKMKYCNKNDISLGVIISSDAKNQASIYKDVNYAKSLVSSYNIDFPIYLSIDNIVESDDLMPDVMIKLIRDFLEKCSSNGMFVGIYGKDSNLCKLKKYSDASDVFSISDYDIYLVQDSEKISYNGVYSIIKDQDGDIENLRPNYNCNAIIKNNLNTPEAFVGDTTYMVGEDDDVRSIAYNAGLSFNELLSYNDIKEKDIKPGTILKIPTSVAKELPLVGQASLDELKEPIKGIDISRYQKSDEADWEKVSQNFGFVILRSNSGMNKDSEFEKHYANCVQNGLPVGIYCYNTCYHNDDFEDFQILVENQNNFTFDCLKNKNITYPIYLDLEPTSKVDGLNFEELSFLLESWVSKVEEYGGIPGLYCNKSTYSAIVKTLNSGGKKELLDKFELWIAGGLSYSSAINYSDVCGEGRDFSYGGISGIMDMHQVTEAGTNAGIGNDGGYVDINLCYINYLKTSEPGDDRYSYIDEDYEFERDKNNMPIIIGSGLACAGAAATYIVFKRKRR